MPPHDIELKRRLMRRLHSLLAEERYADADALVATIPPS